MESNVELISANKSDCKYVYGLLCILEQTEFEYSTFQNNYLDNLNNENVHYFVVMYKNEKCGFISIHSQILLHHNSKIGEIQEFIIDEKYRQKGIGRNVIKIIKEFCTTNNIQQLEVCTNKIRLDTQRFYTDNEFIESHYKYTMKIVKT